MFTAFCNISATEGALLLLIQGHASLSRRGPADALDTCGITGHTCAGEPQAPGGDGVVRRVGRANVSGDEDDEDRRREEDSNDCFRGCREAQIVHGRHVLS